MAPAEVLEAVRNTMLAQESPTNSVELVDILSGNDDEAVTFTSAWETEG